MKNLAAFAFMALASILLARSADAQTVINNICDLQNIKNNLSGSYVLDTVSSRP